jgi:hypothetical protein
MEKEKVCDLSFIPTLTNGLYHKFREIREFLAFSANGTIDSDLRKYN